MSDKIINTAKYRVFAIFLCEPVRGTPPYPTGLVGDCAVAVWRYRGR
jgi:hypothetical protein